MLSSKLMWMGGLGDFPKESKMIELKSCTRCRGDMHLQRDLYGDYKQCLQCGHIVEEPKPDSIYSITRLKADKKVA